MSSHGYEGVIPVLCTPLQVKFYRFHKLENAQMKAQGANKISLRKKKNNRKILEWLY